MNLFLPIADTGVAHAEFSPFDWSVLLEVLKPCLFFDPGETYDKGCVGAARGSRRALHQTIVHGRVACMFCWRQEMFTALLILCLVGGYAAKELYDCNSHKDETVYYTAGEAISLCCTLPGKECSELTADDVVSVVEVNRRQWPPSKGAASDAVINCPGVTDKTPENGVTDETPESGVTVEAPENHTSCDRCSYQFLKENATLSDSGTYHCFINNDSIKFISVHILAKPNASKVLKLSVSDKYVMNVEFEKGDCGPWVKDLTVIMEYRKKVTQLCRVDCSSCQDTCSCEYVPTTEAIPTNPITLTVNVSIPSEDTPLQTTSWTSDFKLFEHIVPSKVEELKLFSVTANEAIVMFRPTGAQLRNIHNMRMVSKPLKYKIFLNRTQGLSEVLRVEFQKTVFYGVSEYPHQFVAVRFTNLTTFTTYRLSVAGVGGGGEGGATTLEFTTNKTEPQSPPKVDGLTYSRILGERSTSSLYLWWQPLPQASRGGSLLSYRLVVTSASGITLSETTVRSAYALLDSLPSRDPLTVKIWADNGIGSSKNYSQMDIPAYQDVQPPMYVEYDFDNNMSYVFINMTGIEGVEMIAIHKCDVSQGSLCTTYPYTQIKQVNSSNKFGGGILMFDMPLAAPTTLTTEECCREVEYFDTEDGGNPFQNPNGHSACANVTLDVDESEGLWDASTTDTYPRLYLSVQVKGSWLGMVRAKCYFTRKAVKVDLVQSAEHDGDKHSLRFTQHCDTGTPMQFLAEHFVIYALPNASTNEECAGPERQRVGEQKNNLFSFNTIDMPSGMKYACVEAVAFNSSTSYTSKMLPYAADSQPSTGFSETNTILVVVFSLVGVLIAVLVFYCTGQRCLERWKHFRELTPNLLSPDSTSSSETYPSQNSSQSIEDLTNVAPQGSSLLSGDSGHWTWDNSKQYRGLRDEDENPAGRPEGRDTTDSSLRSHSSQRNDDENEHDATLSLAQFTRNKNNEHDATLSLAQFTRNNNNEHGPTFPLAPLNQNNNNEHGAIFPLAQFKQKNNNEHGAIFTLAQFNQSNYDADDDEHPNTEDYRPDEEEDSSSSQEDSSNTSAEQRVALENFSFDFNPHMGSDSNSTNTS